MDSVRDRLPKLAAYCMQLVDKEWLDLISQSSIFYRLRLMINEVITAWRRGRPHKCMQEEASMKVRK